MQFASLGQAGTPVTTSALDQAVKSFNSPTLDGPTRASLNDVLTKFTQREDVPSFVGSIFDSQCSPMAKFYGVLALKHFVANFWETMAPDARLQFRGYIWSVMERASMEHQETIRKGMCDAVVGVAKEEYPQVWPSLVEELVRGAQGAPEMVV